MNDTFYFISSVDQLIHPHISTPRKGRFHLNMFIIRVSL